MEDSMERWKRNFVLGDIIEWPNKTIPTLSQTIHLHDPVNAFNQTSSLKFLRYYSSVHAPTAKYS